MEGADHPALAAFWRPQLANLKGSIADIATGRGALAEHFDVDTRNRIQLIPVDFSMPALASQKERHEFVHPVAADVRSLPFGSGSLDGLISQFGVEYGGVEAIERLPGYLKNDGRMILVLHADNSVIYRECATNTESLRKLQDSEFIERSIEMFRIGYAVLRGEKAPEAAKRAALAVMEPLKSLNGLIETHGVQVAGGTIATLCRETARLQQRIQHHVEDDVLGWLETMQLEVESYRQRMLAMTESSLTESQLADLASKFEVNGVASIQRAEVQGEIGLLGWTLTGAKSV